MLKSKHLTNEQVKNASCKPNPARHKKSPKMLKNLVFPIKEYYETPVELTVAKPTNDIFSKESNNSAQTQVKDYSDYLGRTENPKKNDTCIFNKSDFCKSSKMIQEKNRNFVKKHEPLKPKLDSKVKNNVFDICKKEQTKKIKTTIFKNTVLKTLFKFPCAKPGIFKKTLHSDGSIMKPPEIQKFGRSFQKNIHNEKHIAALSVEVIEILLKDEIYLTEFLKYFQPDSTSSDPFPEYLNWAETKDFQLIIDKIHGQKTQILFKSSLLFERVSLYICYFIFKKDVHKEEIIFLKKTLLHIYLNFMALINELKSQISEVS